MTKPQAVIQPRPYLSPNVLDTHSRATVSDLAVAARGSSPAKKPAG
jgi:hypothetical protein